MADETLGGSILQVASPSQLDAGDRARLAAEREEKKRPELTRLAEYIKHAFEGAEKFKATAITARIQDCKRRRDGEYDAEKLAKIKERGGPDTYYNITDTKCDAAESWIQDVFTKAVDTPWALEPTPIPDLPTDVQQQVVETVVQTVQQAVQAGEKFSGARVVELTDQVRDGMLKQLRDAAKQRAEKMSEKIHDQLSEGNYDQAFDEMLHDLVMYPVGILKGPVIENRKRLRWGENGPEVIEEPVPTFYAVQPGNLYPGPNSTSVHDSYICEVMQLDKAHLARMRGAPGYNTKAIEAVLAMSDNPGVLTASGQSDQAQLEGRDTSINAALPQGSVSAIEFWGSVQGNMLLDWGMDKARIPEPLDFYEVTGILIGNHVVKAILNPDPLGRRPYYVTSYVRKSGELWGQSIPEKMKSEQDAANACMRNLISNMGMASGPQTAVDLDALDQSVDPTKQYPFKVWQYHGRNSAGRDPVKWFQPNANAAELLQVEQFFEEKCDDRTQIPRYVHGNDDVKGAGQTASGMNMLMNAAAKGIKRTIKNIDRDIIRPLIECLYRWNLFNLDDEEWGHAKGDCRVVPRGAIASIIREQTQQKRLDFLNLTANPIDMEIIGIVGRAAVLRKIAEELDLDVSEIVPDTEELIAQAQARAQAEAAQASQGDPGEQASPAEAGA